MPFDLINPKGLESPVGYAHVAKITGGTLDPYCRPSAFR